MIPQHLKHFRVRSPYSLPSPELSTSQQLANLEYWQFRPGLGDRRRPIFDYRAIVSHAPKPNFQQTSTTPSFVKTRLLRYAFLLPFHAWKTKAVQGLIDDLGDL